MFWRDLCKQTYMTFQEYISLDNRGKAFAVWYYGTYLTERWQKGYRIKLYALGKFYVEVHYARGGHMVTEMRSFEKLEFLAPYLDRIELRELIAQ